MTEHSAGSLLNDANRCFYRSLPGAAPRALLRRVPSFDMHTHPGLFLLKDIPNSANPREY